MVDLLAGRKRTGQTYNQSAGSAAAAPVTGSGGLSGGTNAGKSGTEYVLAEAAVLVARLVVVAHRVIDGSTGNSGGNGNYTNGSGGDPAARQASGGGAAGKSEYRGSVECHIQTTEPFKEERPNAIHYQPRSTMAWPMCHSLTAHGHSSN